MDLFNEVCSRCNASYSIIPSPDNSYGVLDENGQWGGLIGVLVRDEADLAITSLTITSQRLNVVAFGQPFYKTEEVLVLKGTGITKDLTKFISDDDNCPSLDGSKLSSIISMLDPQVWYLVVTTVMAIISVSLIIPFVLNQCRDVPMNVLALFGLFIGQGFDAKCFSVANRIAMITTLFFGMIFWNIFSARLASSLSVPTATKVSSLEEVGQAGAYKIKSQFQHKDMVLMFRI